MDELLGALLEGLLEGCLGELFTAFFRLLFKRWSLFVISLLLIIAGFITLFKHLWITSLVLIVIGCMLSFLTVILPLLILGQRKTPGTYTPPLQD